LSQPLLPPASRNWTSLAASAAVHLALLALAVGLTRPGPVPVRESRRADPAEQARQEHRGQGEQRVPDR